MCCRPLGRLTRFGVLCGLGAFATLLAAFLGNTWLYTREPVTLPESRLVAQISCRIGLWKVCHHVGKVNGTVVPSSGCASIKYSGWAEITPKDISVWTTLDLAQVFISRMRSCTVLCGLAVVFLVLALLFALIGHCNSDNKTIIACGLFILAGLSLGTGLVVFASSLSETLMEISQYHREPPAGPLYDYRYGWCFFAAGVAFIMTNVAAVLSISGYLNRFSSVDEMVRQMVPGAERKLLEHQLHLSSEYLTRRPCPSPGQYDSLPTERPKYEAECGPLLNKTPPDVCTTNKCPTDFAAPTPTPPVDASTSVAGSVAAPSALAGQTVPITIKNCNPAAPLSFSNVVPIRYGTMHLDASRCSDTLHHHHHQQQQQQQQLQQGLQQGLLGVVSSDVGSSSSTSSSGYCGRSRTLQLPPRARRKCTETFQVPDVHQEAAATADWRRTAAEDDDDFGFSGSAV